MLSEMGMRTMIGGNGEFRRQESHDRERELNIYRSGSAPPTVEGSLSAFGGLFGGYGGGGGGGGEMVLEDELRSDPAYLAYYYANVNLNPRLPPPLVSKQDWLSAQRLQAVGGSIGDRRRTSRAEDGSGRSLFSGQSDARNRGAGGAEWGGDGLIGLPGMGLGSQQNSLADIFQDELGHVAPVSGNTYRPASRAAYNDGVDALGSAKAKLVQLHHASALGASMSRNNTPDPQLVVRGSSPCLPPVGGRIDNRSINGPKAFNDIPSAMGETTDLAAALSGMRLSKNGVADGESCVRSHIQQEIDDHQNFLFSLQAGQSHIKQNAYPKKSESGRLHVHSVPSTALYPELGKNNGVEVEPMNSLLARQQGELLKPAVSSANSLLKGLCIPNLNSPGGSPQFQCANVPNAAFPNYCSSGNFVNSTLPSAIIDQFGNGNVTPLFENIAAASAMAAPGMDPRAFGAGLPNGMNLVGTPELQNVNTMGQVPLMDPLYLQNLRTAEYAAAQVAALNDPSPDRKYKANSYMDLVALQKAYLEALLLAQKSQYVPLLGKSNGLNHGYCGHPNFGFGVPYPIVPNLPVGPGSPLRHSEQDMRFLSGMRNLSGGVMDSWHLQAGGNMDESFASSLLEEFKNNKTRCFELTEIAGHVVEFSADQYGSRFIQQKLETATTDEKDMVFKEIMPQVFSLMTDVFGNYVIQKFFEHGTTSQRRELADELIGHVLTLSLQMYGCRVIQKAIEVVDLDQQTKMVAELDGHVMRCVRDQNGNHVIQKCIECIPQDAIEFIVSSFYDQVVTLSTHPYGCRVIQRVLEHCDNPKTQRIMMDEILQHVCKLAKDQYGNYVVQHVLEHGKPHERSTIITKLAGQIVEMSQQKFASNVVEKCLCFGGPEERQILVNEMLGSTDENEPLQAMMKDQFANYVVQKVLETCDDQQRELILSRIKVHLNALKKYTYGKHIVARVEKLVTAGERRSSLLSLYPA